jgi:hypothetical protein
MNEPDSQTGNDIGGYSAYAGVTAGSSTAAPTVTTNVGGTLTNVRGPVVLLRVREVELPPTQDLTPDLFTSGQTFHDPTVVRGAVTLSPALFSNGQTFYSPNIAVIAPEQSLTPPRYDNAQTFIAATVAASYSLTPARYDNAQQFFAPEVSASYTLAPARYDNAQEFFAATLTTSVSLAPGLYGNAPTFFGSVISQTGGPQALVPDLLANQQAFYPADVTPGAVALQPALAVNEQAFLAPLVVASYTLAPALAVNQPAFYAPTVAQTVPGQALAPELLANASTFHNATVTPGPVALVGDGYVDDSYVATGYVGPATFSTQAFPPATVTPGPITLQPALLGNAGQFFAPAVELQLRVITRAQAQLLRRIHALHGLATAPLVVGPNARSAGDITQTISQAGQSVTISTTTADDVLLVDVGQMIEELAALHGITTPLTVTPTSRTAGAIVQSLATVGSVTTVTRQ